MNVVYSTGLSAGNIAHLVQKEHPDINLHLESEIMVNPADISKLLRRETNIILRFRQNGMVMPLGINNTSMIYMIDASTTNRANPKTYIIDIGTVVAWDIAEIPKEIMNSAGYASRADLAAAIKRRHRCDITMDDYFSAYFLKSIKERKL